MQLLKRQSENLNYSNKSEVCDELKTCINVFVYNNQKTPKIGKLHSVNNKTFRKHIVHKEAQENLYFQRKMKKVSFLNICTQTV